MGQQYSKPLSPAQKRALEDRKKRIAEEKAAAAKKSKKKS